MELYFVAVLLVLKLENFLHEWLNFDILQFLDLIDCYLGLLFERDQLVLHFLLVVDVILFSLFEPFELVC